MRNAEYGMLIVALSLLAGCGEVQKGSDTDGGVLREDMSWGPVQMEVALEPERVRLNGDSVLTITITAPSDVEVSLPDLDDRVEGFVVAGTFDEEPFAGTEKTTTIRHVRLTPTLSETYRLRPFAVRYVDRRVNPARTDWFPTRPIVFKTADLVKGVPGKTIEPVLEPVWIHPSFRTVATGVAGVLAAIALGVLIWRLARRVKRHVELMRLSPRERALKELERLVSRHLVERDMVKDFYMELTMIVRRYIERQYAVRAPEQTTDEFLAAAVEHPRFTPRVVTHLREFLRAADLVKFADYHPDAGVIDQATATARKYIETDAPEIRADKEKQR